jgi:hypothetical protein
VGREDVHPGEEIEAPTRIEEDSRWQLVERILATSAFARSQRLSDFLQYVCKETLEGRGNALSEQQIGEVVFGRPPGYDSSADSIVRSHALRLRQRLDQFFARAGRDEPLRLRIPRGRYSVVFEPAPINTFEVAEPAYASTYGEPKTWPSNEELAVPENTELEGISESAAAPASIPAPLASPAGPGRRFGTLHIAISLAILAVFCLFLKGSHREGRRNDRRNSIWPHLFTNDQPTRIVLGDSGLVLFHAVNRKYLSLDDYLAKRYKAHLAGVQHVDSDFAVFLTTRRYTSMVDASTVLRLTRLPEASPDRTLVQYARDMRLDDFKNGNLILIGAQEADPWVELFERSMNFVFTTDTPNQLNAFRNREPQAGESQLYGPSSSDDKSVYAVVAFLPNLNQTGNVLLLEGLNMAGTEAAADLVLDDARFSPVLAKVRRPDGSLPYFEMLLECSTLTDNATPARVVALHIHPS